MNLSSDFPRAVCFDLYGTLVDISVDTKSQSTWEILAAELKAHDVGADPHQLRATYDHLVESERREHGQAFVLDRLFFCKLLNCSAKALNAHAVRSFGRRFRALTTCYLRVKPYALELIRVLREHGCKLAIVSNTEEILTSHDLDELDLHRYFDAVVLSSSVGVKKPDVQIFHIAARQLGVSPRQCLFIGDDYECDYVGPRRAGLQALLLSDNGAHSHTNFVRPELASILRAIEVTSSAQLEPDYAA